MADDRHPLSPAAIDLAERALDVLDDTDHLQDGVQAAAPRAVAFGELYAYATDPAYQASPALTQALGRDLALRRDLERLLRNTATQHLPRVAAASSGAIQARETETCRIAFRPSRADPGQIYVILEMKAPGAEAPSVLFAFSPDRRWVRLPLPEASDGRIQVLLDADSEVLQALRDIHTEVYLT